MTDTIRLTLPAQEDFRQVAHLVVGGLGARLALTYEDLEDLQVAFDALLACRDDEEALVVALDVDEDVVRATVGPFEADALDRPGDLPLRRVLETVCQSVAVEERDGGSWVDLTKRVSA